MKPGTIVSSSLGRGIVVETTKHDTCQPLPGITRPDHLGSYKTCVPHREAGEVCDCVRGRMKVIWLEGEQKWWERTFRLAHGDSPLEQVVRSWESPTPGLEASLSFRDGNPAFEVVRLGEIGDRDNPIREGSVFRGWDCHGDSVFVECYAVELDLDPCSEKDDRDEGIGQNCKWYVRATPEPRDEDEDEDHWDPYGEEGDETPVDLCLACALKASLQPQ